MLIALDRFARRGVSRVAPALTSHVVRFGDADFSHPPTVRRFAGTERTLRAWRREPPLRFQDVARRKHAQPCKWCGREVDDAELGRRRQYCRQSCRQRAYEQRAAVKGTSVPADAVVLTADEATDLADRVYQARCAAEDVATAVEEGATHDELRELCEELLRAAKAADGWR